MADRYTATIQFTAVDESKPGGDPDHETTVIWRDIPYAGLVELEKALVGVLQQTTEWGTAAVEVKQSAKT